MLWLFLLACSTHRVDALEAEVAELRAADAAQAAELEQLRAAQAAQAEELAAIHAVFDAIGGLPTASPASTPAPAETVTVDGPAGPTSAVLVRVAVSPEDLALARSTGALWTQLRVLPHAGPDGAHDGVRLSAIRADSLATRLGLKNGDVAHAFRVGDGAWSPTTSMEELSKVYLAFQAATADRGVELLVARRTTPTLLRFAVQ